MTDEAPEVIKVQKKVVSCDGGGTLGHPLIYLNFGSSNRVECPYCDRLFILETENSSS